MHKQHFRQDETKQPSSVILSAAKDLVPHLREVPRCSTLRKATLVILSATKDLVPHLCEILRGVCFAWHIGIAFVIAFK